MSKRKSETISYLYPSGIAICAYIVVSENTGGYIGRFFNHFFPCAQNQAQSAPCYTATSIVAIILAGLVGVILTIVYIFKLTNNSRRHTKTHVDVIT